MMGERRVMQETLFYGFSLERHVPDGHLLRKIDRFVDLSDVRAHLEPYYRCEVGRPSIDPELMIRMLIVGYYFGVRSEQQLPGEVHLNLAIAGFFAAWGSAGRRSRSFDLFHDLPGRFPRERPVAQAVRGRRVGALR